MSQETWKVEGMTCNNCALGLKKQLENLGLNQVDVSFPLAEVQFESTSKVNKESITSLIASLGFQVIEEDNATPEKFWNINRLFYASLIFTFPLFAHMFFDASSLINNFWVQLTLCLPVYFIGVLHFGKSAYQSLKGGVPNMDVLIFTGTSAAFFYSILGYILHEGENYHTYLFFETSATIITLVLLGNLLEKNAVKRTGSALKSLMALKNIVAKKITQNGLETISSKDLKISDLVQLNNGDAIPADGILTEGGLNVDESMISGESLVVQKQVNAPLYAGTIVKHGSGKLLVQKSNNQSIIAQIIDLVKKAQSEKPDIQKLGDKVSSIFVPAVILISILTFCLNYWLVDITLSNSLMRAIAVLVISCPCAMGLATPTAVMVGLGRAAKQGILIKGGNILEKFVNVDTFLFDKTGTLTTGKFKISNFQMKEGLDQQYLHNIIYTLELHSSHPIAFSLQEILEGDKLAMVNIEEIKGRGIKGFFEDKEWFIGRSIDPNKSEALDINLYQDNEWVAGFNLEDDIKPEAKSCISALQSMGKDVVLLSGDKEDKCLRVAKELGIKTIYSEKTPKEKLAILDEIQEKAKAAMIGDGINDAPSLAKAHVSISFSEATEVAMHSADIVLLKPSKLHQIHTAYLIAKHSVKTIKQNLFWAFFYNVIAIPIAATGLLVPMYAALAMAFSDVIVIGNSIRLKKKNLT